MAPYASTATSQETTWHTNKRGPNPKIGVWARVSVRPDGKLVSIDRGAHPTLTAYFNESNDAKNEYNTDEPANDWEKYLVPWTAVLEHTTGNSL